MNYNPITKKLEITTEKADTAAQQLLWAMKHIRLSSGLPLDKYEHDGPLNGPDFAMKGILDAAKELGIDFGVQWGCQLDLREIDK